MNALFTPLDMTDYENTFVGYNEIEGAVPTNSPHLLKPLIEEPWPMNHAPVEITELEARDMLARSKTHQELLETKAAEAEAGDEEEEEEEGEGAEGEEGEEGEAAEETAATGEEVAEEVDEFPYEERVPHAKMEDRYFMHGENLRN